MTISEKEEIQILFRFHFETGLKPVWTGLKQVWIGSPLEKQFNNYFLSPRSNVLKLFMYVIHECYLLECLVLAGLSSLV